MLKSALRTSAGFLVAFAVGAACRLFGIPLPAPPMITGAILVMAISVGYIITDHSLSHINRS